MPCRNPPSPRKKKTQKMFFIANIDRLSAADLVCQQQKVQSQPPSWPKVGIKGSKLAKSNVENGHPENNHNSFAIGCTKNLYREDSWRFMFSQTLNIKVEVVSCLLMAILWTKRSLGLARKSADLQTTISPIRLVIQKISLNNADDDLREEPDCPLWPSLYLDS